MSVDLDRVDVADLDPYAFLAVLGKRVIHPGGRRASREVVSFAEFGPDQDVLDIGCGVATSAIEVARSFGARVTAADISPLMLKRARANVQRAGVADKVTVQEADILRLPYQDASFDRVVAEAVTMFVDRRRAAAELVRVCRPGGRVLATEFCWRRPPTAEARQLFLGEVCPGMQFDTVEEWTRIYGEAGLTNLRVASGPFDMMTPRGFLADEGPGNTMRIVGAALTPARIRKMVWLMPRMMRAVPYLGYVVVAGDKATGSGSPAS